MPIRAVLWDADGVLQQVPGSWASQLIDIIGEDRTRALLTDTWPIAHEAMCGRVDMRVALGELLVAHELSDVGYSVREVWGTFDRYDDTRELVSRVRALGPRCHLATNQDQLRASYMRERLGYDDLFDSSFYSCDVGAKKPEAAYFETVAQRLGAGFDEIAFIDDIEANVVAAGALDIHAIHWHHRDGLAVLEAALQGIGLG